MYSVILMTALTASTTAPGCWFKASHGCHGCYGGFRNGCYGCYGAASYGCYGCAGYGCYGGGCYGCYGGYAVYYGGCFGCHGCYGCYGCYGCAGYQVVPSTPMTPAAPVEKPAEPVAPPVKTDEGAKPGQAKLIIDLPADAKLYIDNQLMKTTSERRTFNTPNLDRGQLYYYVLRAEVVHNGKVHSETKRVIVQAGEETRTTFAELQAVVKDRDTATARR
jgi:uncharacterized protein (TIGR03000 family)